MQICDRFRRLQKQKTGKLVFPVFCLDDYMRPNLFADEILDDIPIADTDDGKIWFEYRIFLNCSGCLVSIPYMFLAQWIFFVIGIST